MAAVILVGATFTQGAGTVGAIGHIRSSRGIITVTGPMGDTVKEVLVEVGDAVAAGDLSARPVHRQTTKRRSSWAGRPTKAGRMRWSWRA